MTDFKRGTRVQATILGTMVRRPDSMAPEDEAPAQIRLDGSSFFAVVPANALELADSKPCKVKVDWSARFAELSSSTHLKEQVRRVMPALELIKGTASAPSFDDVMREVITGIIALETYPDGNDTTYGMVAVRRNPASGYDLLLPASTIYDLHLRMEDNPNRKDPA